jgi:hypothetical protein
MIDGYDVWLQLRPQTLINRYFAINRRADARTRQRDGQTAPRQEIIFGCQKRCWPWAESDPPCYAVPQSTLPERVYGDRTDTPGPVDHPYVNYRPRFLNSGTGIGTGSLALQTTILQCNADMVFIVRAMRKLFDQALIQARQESNFGSDQYILSHIFGDQEVWRESVRQDSQTETARLGEEVMLLRDFNPQHMAEVRQKAKQREDRNFEFGIGVDYGSEIVLNTVFAEDDTDWLRNSDIDQVAQAKNLHGLIVSSSVSEDVKTALASSRTPSMEQDLPHVRTWSDLRLLTDIFTNNVPAVIHHNAHRDGLKSRRETWWPLVWFQSNARLLMDAYIRAPVMAFARSRDDDGTVRAWWPLELRKGSARDGISASSNGWISFEDICRDYHEEIFRDGKGPWKQPTA